MARVTLEHVTKQYDTQDAVTLTGYRGAPALDAVSLDVGDGETVGVVGPSGCGKSTLLKVVAGLEYPDKGRVRYDDTDMTEIKPQDRGVGMVFQDYALYPSMKGKGNLAYYFEQHGHDEDEQRRRVRETAELMGVGFDLLLGRTPGTLSGGEQQRVAIARCIVRDPRVFLMDEPICNLDAKLRERTRIEIKKLLRRFGITTLYVTHDQQEAIFMGDRIAVMRRGAIEQVGSYDEVYYTPANLFVAAFIGTPPMTVLPAEVAGRTMAVGATRWPLPDALASALAPGPVRLGVRPEGWLLDAEDGAPLALRHVERLPTEQTAVLHGTIAGTGAVALAPLDYPEPPTREVLASPPTVRVTPDWERAYVFAADDEAALHVPGAPELF